MLTEKQLERYADVLLWALKKARSGRFKKYELIQIRYDRPALRLAEILYSRILEMGMRPIQRMNLSTEMEKSFFKIADKRQITDRIPGEEELYNNLSGAIHLRAPLSLTHLKNVDTKKIGMAFVAGKYLREILDARDEQGLFGWTLCMLPTEALAEHAGLTLEKYTAEVVRACFLNKKDPVAEWEAVFKNAMRIKKWLNKLDIRSLRVESARMDLTVTPGEKRRWIGISGHNIPSFEIFLSPDWRGTSGVYFANQPSYRSGNYVENVRLTFKNGVVTDMAAETGEPFLRSQVGMDKGAARVGEFSLTDKRFSRIGRFMANTLYDENFGGRYGNCHLALGSSYSDAYDGDPADLTREEKDRLGFNDSALHWDLVNTEKKRVTATLAGGAEKVIYENGVFAH